MDAPLQGFITNYMGVAQLRNVSLENPVIFEMRPSGELFLIIAAYSEPTFANIPYNILWMVMDENDVDHGKILRRVSHADADGRRSTWAEVDTYADLFSEEQYHQNISEVEPHILGVDGSGAPTAGVNVLGLVLTTEDGADPVAIESGDPRLTDERAPTAHSHADFPRTMVNITGTEYLVINGADVPLAGQVLFLEGEDATNSNVKYGTWRFPTENDIVGGPITLSSIVLEGPSTINEQTSTDFNIRAYYSDGSNALVDGTFVVDNGTDSTIDNDGGFTANNVTADTVVMVTGSFGGITADKNITIIADPEPVGITISGANVVNELSTSQYTFVVNMSDGSEVSVDSSLAESWTVTAGASIDAAGLLTADDISGTIQVTIEAAYNSFTDQLVIDVTDGVTLQALEVIGATSMNEQTTENYTVQLRFSDNSTTVVTAESFSVNNIAAANMSNAGALTALDISTDATVRITATYTHDGNPISGNLDVDIIADIELSSINITGPASVPESTSDRQYMVTAYYTDGSNAVVTPDTLTLDDNVNGSIAANGTFTANSVASDTPIVITASYTEDGITKQDTLNIEIIADIELSSITIQGAASVDENTSSNYTVLATYTDGSTSLVTPDTFTKDASTFCTLSGQQLSVGNLTVSGETTTLSASFTENGITETDTLEVTLIDSDLAPVSIEVVGSATPSENSNTQYSIVVTYDDGSTAPYAGTATWATTQGTITTGGLLITGSVTSDTPTTVTVDVTIDGVAMNDSISVTIQDNQLELVRVEVVGASPILEGETGAMALIATYDDGSTSAVAADNWSITSGGSYASIDAAGVVTGLNVAQDETVTVQGQVTLLGISRSSTLDIVIEYIPPVLQSINIRETGVSIIEGNSYNFTVQANYSDGSNSVVVPDSWSIVGNAQGATIAGGQVDTIDVGATVDITIRADYSEGGVNTNDSTTVTITDVPAAGLGPRWGYGVEPSTLGYVYDEAFLATLTNDLSDPVISEQFEAFISFSESPPKHLYVAIPASYGVIKFFNVTANYNELLTGAKNPPSYVAATAHAEATIDGETWYIYASDFPNFNGPFEYRIDAVS